MKITAAIPAHPARVRNGMLQRAIDSVYQQTKPAAALSVALDLDREGAPATRQRALDMVQTEWVAFLDSDDYWLPNHLEALSQWAQEQQADYVYSYWTGAADVLGHFGKVFDPANPTETTMTILIRTELAKQVGFKALEDRKENTGEDWRMTLGCIELGAKIVHLPMRTWVWSHHGQNSSGLPTKGDARL